MEEMTRLFNLDFQLLHDTVLLAIAIFFLFLALSYLLFNPVRKMLKDRQEKIATDIDTALADKKDAAALKAEYEAKLKNIDKEAEQILSEARQKALKLWTKPRKRLLGSSRERTRKQSFPRNVQWMR